jgi:hypothetical protein
LGVQNAGKSFPLNNASIRQVNSPQSRLQGPYTSVHIDQAARWVIVACDWDGYPSLAIRWFHDTKGNPVSNDYSTWLILPSLLHTPILNALPIQQSLCADITAFLNGTMTGAVLQTKYP